LYNIATDPRLGHHPEVVHGVMASDCAAVLTELFKNLREKRL
jgi:tRNA(Arg) A34 adenosine deaminase TadA